VLATAFAGGLAAAALSAAAQVDSNHLVGNHLGRFTITQTDSPPDVLARVGNLREASLLTEAVLEKGDIKEVRAYRDFLRKTARRGSKADQLKAVNDYVANTVRLVADSNLYKGSDVWAPPINTLILGGDCEDIALVKFWGLAYVGFARQAMFLVVGVSSAVDPPAGHAVLAVRLPSGSSDGSYVLLDSLERRVQSIDEATRFEPVYAVGVDGYWIVDDPTHDWGEFWRSTFKAAADRNGR
jgi:predicted transglutaminase-like cysteine proteinase